MVSVKAVVDQREFLYSHGTKPRGFGLWVFAAESWDEVWEFQYTGTYSEAAKAAARNAEREGIRNIKVCS